MDWFGPNPQNFVNLIPRERKSYEWLGVGGLELRGGRIVFGLERGLGLEREERE